MTRMQSKILQFPVRSIDPSWRTYRFAMMRAEHRRQQRRRFAAWIALYVAAAALGMLSAYVGYWLGGL